MILEERKIELRKKTMLDAGELTPHNLDHIDLWTAEIVLATRFMIGALETLPGEPVNEDHAAIRRKAMTEASLHAPVDGEEALYWLDQLLLRVAVIQYGPVSHEGVALLSPEQQIKARRVLKAIEEGEPTRPVFHLVKTG